MSTNCSARGGHIYFIRFSRKYPSTHLQDVISAIGQKSSAMIKVELTKQAKQTSP